MMINVQVGAFSHVPKNEPLHVWARLSEEENGLKLLSYLVPYTQTVLL